MSEPPAASPTDRLLIINADDFGLTPAVSEGILRAHREGVVTSTSVLVLGSGYTRSIGALADTRGIGVGVHLALVGEDAPVLSASEVPTLVDRRGRLPLSWRQLLPRVTARRIDLADVERELSAQIEAAVQAGLVIDHLNSHQHVHMFPGIRTVVVDLAQRFDIPAIRVTRSASKGPVGRVMRRLATHLEAELRADGVAFTAASAGLDEAGRLDEGAVVTAIGRLAASGGPTAELSGHPGEAVDGERGRYKWNYRWGAELEAMLSPAVRGAVDNAELPDSKFRRHVQKWQPMRAEQLCRGVV